MAVGTVRSRPGGRTLAFALALSELALLPRVLSLKSIRKRLTISSTIEDFPAPPVPVIPSTGTADFSAMDFTISREDRF